MDLFRKIKGTSYYALCGTGGRKRYQNKRYYCIRICANIRGLQFAGTSPRASPPRCPAPGTKSHWIPSKLPLGRTCANSSNRSQNSLPETNTNWDSVTCVLFYSIKVWNKDMFSFAVIHVYKTLNISQRRFPKRHFRLPQIVLSGEFLSIHKIP